MRSGRSEVERGRSEVGSEVGQFYTTVSMV